MNPRSFPILAAALALAVVILPADAAGQAVVQPLPGTTDADRLAGYMRRLAVDPRDAATLVEAGELSLRLDDLSAAAALFARAEKVDPRNPRIKAGMASILVRSERPGEALRYFAQAEAMGLAPARFAADRGLAYDLIGEQERAQRDYRLALRDAPGDDETIRRYALSLGISGRREQALAQLDPLLRKTDRGAWRARAFVLAMAGDQPAAERIATTMMPSGMAAGLQSFFARLPALSATDRAFAVHFGEVRATPERLADARMVPALAALPSEPGAITRIAVVAATPAPRQDRRNRKAKPGRVELAAAVPVQTQPALPPPPSPRQSTPAVVRATPSLELAARTPVQTPTPRPSVSTAAAPITSPPAAAVPVEQPPVALAATTPPVALAATTPPAAPEPTPTDATPPRTVAARVSEDSILARIIAGLSIPASELDVAEPVRAAPVPATPANVVAVAREKEARDTAAQKLVAAKVAAEPAPSTRSRRGGKPVAADVVAAKDVPPPARKPLDRKALAAKKAADEKKLADAQAAAEEKKAARSNPSRIWVQVSGGANEGDLPKAWKSVQARAPALAGKAGYATPLRATNRVVTGPFKTDAEARAFVNTLAKQGVSAFTFTSDAGQKVAKLPPR